MSLGNLTLISSYASTVVIGILVWRRGRWHVVRRGLRRRRAARDMAQGAGIGAAALGGLFAVLWGLDGLEVDALTVQPALLASSLPVYAVLALAEELAFRGVALPALAVLLDHRLVAAAIVVALTVLNHLFRDGVDGLSVLSSALGGVMYTVAYLATGTIWLPVGLHLAWNFLQGPILGFPVSGKVGVENLVQQHPTGPEWLTGGAYGPEGGVVGIAARVAVIAALFAVSAQRGRRLTRSGRTVRIAA